MVILLSRLTTPTTYFCGKFLDFSQIIRIFRLRYIQYPISIHVSRITKRIDVDLIPRCIEISKIWKNSQRTSQLVPLDSDQ